MLHLDIIDVGHGNSAVLRNCGVNVVFDAAPGGALVSYMVEHGINSVDLFVLSHADYDHIGGLIALLNSGIRIGKVIVNSDGTKGSETWRDLLFALDDAQRRGVVEFEIGITEGKLEVPGLKDCTLEVLSPSRALAGLGAGGKSRCGRTITSNTISAVVRVKQGDRGVALLAGDMDSVALTELEEHKLEMNADLLVYPHHGGLPGEGDVSRFVERLCGKVEPKVVVFSNGRGRYDNPREEVVNAVKRVIGAGYICCTQLSERCAEHHPDNLPRKKFKHCAGRITTNIEGGNIVYSSKDSHDAFVGRLSEIPMCVFK